MLIEGGSHLVLVDINQLRSFTVTYNVELCVTDEGHTIPVKLGSQIISLSR